MSEPRGVASRRLSSGWEAATNQISVYSEVLRVERDVRLIAVKNWVGYVPFAHALWITRRRYISLSVQHSAAWVVQAKVRSVARGRPRPKNNQRCERIAVRHYQWTGRSRLLVAVVMLMVGGPAGSARLDRISFTPPSQSGPGRGSVLSGPRCCAEFACRSGLRSRPGASDQSAATEMSDEKVGLRSESLVRGTRPRPCPPDRKRLVLRLSS